MGFLLNRVYSALGIDLNDNAYDGLQWIAIYVFIFILYRNKLQFSGWYKGKKLKKLPKSFTLVMVSGAIILLLLPFLG